MLKLGTAKRCITPQAPVRMAGYATRMGPFDGVIQDIFTRVYVLEQAGKQVMLVYADLLWWNSMFIAWARPKLAELLDIPQEQILFVASHNHSGPGTGDNFTDLLETVDASYTQYLYQQVEEAVLQAQQNLEQVVAICHRGSCKLNVYRRIMTERGITMAPNYTVPADEHLTLVRFQRVDGRDKGLLIHYPCHANLSDGNQIHPDYPGVAMELLEEESPDCLPLFLQGCTGDLRPNSVLGERFVSQNFDGVKKFARQFVDQCLQTMRNPGRLLGEELKIFQVTEKLPVEQSCIQERRECAEAGDLACQQWLAECEKKQFRSYELLELTRLELGGLNFFFFNSEVSQYYSAYARKLKPGALTSGYTNGMIGYLADERQIREGGYEPEGSAVYFAVAGVYSSHIQRIIESVLEKLANDQ